MEGANASVGQVASGPFGDKMLQSAAGYPLGVLVHFGIMLIIAAAYIGVAPRFPALLRHPIVVGPVYGLLIWGVMYRIVRPLRWPDMPLPTAGGAIGVAKQLFSYCILVGIPVALVAARTLKRRSGFAR